VNWYNEIDNYAADWLENLIKEGMIPDGRVERKSVADVEPSYLEGYAQCHFFAGIAGWSEALKIAGVPQDFPVWTGSCPCQPFSAAGKQKGSGDERDLWPVWFRLIRKCRPPVIFGEQVASKLGRAWLAGVFADLEALGYRVAGADLCAAGVSAPFPRQRLFWLATDDTNRSGLQGIRISKSWAWGKEQFERLVQDELSVSVPSGKSGGLVDGVYNRPSKLCAYGNAIVPQVAAAFIVSALEAICEPRP